MKDSATFAITDTKLCVPVVTLSTQDNTKLLQQLKIGFKRIVNWKKYTSHVEQKKKKRKQYLNRLIDSSFQGVNRISVLSFGNVDHHIKREGITNYYLPKVEIKYKNVMIDGRNFFLINLMKKHKSIRKH